MIFSSSTTPFMTKNATAANSKTLLWGLAPTLKFDIGA